VARRGGGAQDLGEVGGGGLIETKRERMRSERMVKRVRSTFRVMTGRCGRMTGRGGGSVRSRSSKLLE
jgi:hypothetical protein